MKRKKFRKSSKNEILFQKNEEISSKNKIKDEIFNDT